MARPRGPRPPGGVGGTWALLLLACCTAPADAAGYKMRNTGIRKPVAQWTASKPRTRAVAKAKYGALPSAGDRQCRTHGFLILLLL